MYGDVEELIRGWYETITAANGVTVIVEPDEGIPSNLVYLLPLVAVSRYGGADDTLTIDTANIDVDVFAADYGSARDLALDLWTRSRRDMPGPRAAGMTVCRVGTITAPVRAPWEATGVHRVHMALAVTVHARIGAGS